MINFEEEFLKAINEFKLKNKESIVRDFDEKLTVKSFENYLNTLLEWNEKINLTAIKDAKDVIIKHFVDSLSVAYCVDFEKSSRMIDIGTGAGLPGVPQKIILKDLNITLLDSLNKRINFLKELTKVLNIKAEIICARAEEFGKNKNYRESFDVATSRAVAPLNVLLEYTLPFVKKGGIFISMKSKKADEEIELSKNSAKELGASLSKKITLCLPDGSQRCLIVYKKTKNTSIKYPRVNAIISKSPL